MNIAVIGMKKPKGLRLNLKTGPKDGITRHDISHRKFGNLTVVSYVDSKTGNSRWLCLCDCGKEVIVASCHLKSGHTTSCGCLKLLKQTIHGKSGTMEYAMFISAKHRAKQKNLDFNIELSDIVIPYRCPIFGNKFYRDPDRNDSPSLDRIDSIKGYIKGNVWVISRRANIIKNNATPAELRIIADAVDYKISEILNV